MSDNKRKLTVFRVISWGILWTAMTTRVFAAVVPSSLLGSTSAPKDKWSEVRGELGAIDRPKSLSRDLVDLVKNVDLNDLEETVRLSYTMVPIEDAAALDSLWLKTLSKHATSVELAAFLKIRNAIDHALATDGQYAESWVWRVTETGGDDCDGDGADA